MLLSPTDINYVEIVLASALVSTHHTNLGTSLDAYSQSPWLGSLGFPDPLTETFPSNEIIMEIMSLEETPWNGTHHHSSFFPRPTVMSTCIKKFSSHFPTQPLQIPS